MAFPLACVVVVSMVKDAFEDFKRHKADDQENNTMANVFDPKTKSFKDIYWKKIHVGDIVRLKSDEFIPADLLILHTSDDKGTCYVETKGLDGETNLKIKTANKDLQQLFTTEESLANIEGEIKCEGPNNAIYKYEGMATVVGASQAISLNVDNLLLRGSRLMNTEWAYCQCIYQGHDTKIMMNSAKAKYKFSKLDLLTNKTIALTLCVQILLALLGSVVGASWTAGNGAEALYMDSGTNEPEVGFGMNMVQFAGTWVLIFTNFVPISLMVTLELVKFWQAIFMSNDHMMYDEL